MSNSKQLFLYNITAIFFLPLHLLKIIMGTCAMNESRVTLIYCVIATDLLVYDDLFIDTRITFTVFTLHRLLGQMLFK